MVVGPLVTSVVAIRNVGGRCTDNYVSRGKTSAPMTSLSSTERFRCFVTYPSGSTGRPVRSGFRDGVGDQPPQVLVSYRFLTTLYGRELGPVRHG